MPEEILAIVIISIFAGTAMSIIRMVLGYKERKGLRGSSHGSSLTTSELERMMRRAVEEATLPLARKIEALESSMEPDENSLQLEGPREEPLLDPHEGTEEEAQELVSAKRRERA